MTDMDTTYADACIELQDALASLHSRLGDALTDKEFAEELRRYATEIDGQSTARREQLRLASVINSHAAAGR